MMYQSELLAELVRSAETRATPSEAEADRLRQRIANATSQKDIAALWRDVEQTYELLDEQQWSVQLTRVSYPVIDRATTRRRSLHQEVGVLVRRESSFATNRQWRVRLQDAARPLSGPYSAVSLPPYPRPFILSI